MKKEHLMQFNINSLKKLANLMKRPYQLFRVNKIPNGKQLEEFPLKLSSS